VPIDEVRLSGNAEGWIVTKQTSLTMIRIPAGQFERQVGSENEEKRQVVQISGDFLLSDREITINLFQRFVNDEEYRGDKPTAWEGEYNFPDASPAHPVQKVNWYDAVMFCNWLSRKENRTPFYKLSNSRIEKSGLPGVPDANVCDVEIIEGADGFRLPTEAEWEYACRAGTTTRFSFGDDEAMLTHYGVYATNSNAITARVCTRLCNAWGLFDMHGNVWEWCWDDYEADAEVQGSLDTEVQAPLGPTGGRVVRGGCWGVAAWECESSYGSWFKPTDRYHNVSFRVAADAPGT
jgi:formylglycine-generating enzyme required for sulfatase activity